jgi:hypothetical protein
LALVVETVRPHCCPRIGGVTDPSRVVMAAVESLRT